MTGRSALNNSWKNRVTARISLNILGDKGDESHTSPSLPAHLKKIRKVRVRQTT